MLTGILLGMIVGVALAAGLAWLILRSPSPFVNKEPGAKPLVETSKPAAEVVRPATVDVAKPKVDEAVTGASGVEEAKPRFEFYKVLTDKPDAATDTQAKAADKPKTADGKSAENKPADKPAAVAKYLQAGSFANAADAENLKASLAMKGLDATVQTVNIPGKGEMHRVRVGPFANEQDLNNARGTLKLNGL
jgi:cell division protein FtsN